MFGIDKQANIIGIQDATTERPARALCIHGHFYQPPREDPITGFIPQEKGAAPFNNWNEKIHAECYRPNAELGNFERISFNVGPTLFRWMESYDPTTYHRIIAQDQCNVERFGVGNAMAQAYNHTILPHATRRDKITQIAWGMADFEHHFGRKPQGMWLPETAVDLETLDVMAEQGIEFTILAPWQADIDNLDPSQPYWVALPGGRRMAVFFYHGPLSGGVSFNQGLTNNAHDFALNNLSENYLESNTKNGKPQILVVASDGELYGHHQEFRDWFLAYLVNGAGARAGLQLTFPALWLHQHPPEVEIFIRENTSWSCHHGVARWAEACGCAPSAGWKAPLRLAFDNLAQALDDIYAKAMLTFGVDPWDLRNNYIQAILGDAEVGELIAVSSQRSAVSRGLAGDGIEQISTLLEAQRFRQAMYTSCGWFFDEFDRIEPQNNIAYATRAVELTASATGIDLAEKFMGDLESAGQANASQ